MTCEFHGGNKGSTFCKFCDAELIAEHEMPMSMRAPVSLSERVKTLECALRMLLEGKTEAAKSLMEMSNEV